MAIEIERKFLVKGTQWKNPESGELFRQGYLSLDPEQTVRVRVVGGRGSITIKGKTDGVSRVEYEYQIPLDDALEMLEQLCVKPQIEKIRYSVSHAGFVWEVDEFLGENAGLVVAEIELSTDEQSFELPEWVGQEVSDDPRYYNSSLVINPYSRWTEK